MSSIKSKDLSFQKQEPAFLRRIRESTQASGDRHERPVARPQRLRDPNQDEEDAPTYVDEEGDTLSKAEYDAMLKEEAGETGTLGETVEPTEDVGGVVKGDLAGSDPKASGAIRCTEDGGGDDDAKDRRKQQVIDAGGPSKKRKVAKVVGGEDEDGEARGKEPKPGIKKAKKKGKPIKLSFDNDES